MSQEKPPRDIPLVPFRDFAAQVPKILATSKRESDDHLASLQAENAKRRASKKKSV
jgi:hypothetical protein